MITASSRHWTTFEHPKTTMEYRVKFAEDPYGHVIFTIECRDRGQPSQWRQWRLWGMEDATDTTEEDTPQLSELTITEDPSGHVILTAAPPSPSQ